jgi:small subunit ribosomal protein S17
VNENRISKIGRVMSARMDKTVVVRVETLKQHPLYRKTIRYRVKFKAHDEANACHIGDTVKIAQTRPLSKTKRWEVVEILRREKMP